MNALKKWRLERALSLSELAHKSTVAPSTISQIENDRRKAYGITLSKLAKALDVPLETFIDLMDTSALERGRQGGRPKEDRLTAASQPAA